MKPSNHLSDSSAPTSTPPSRLHSDNAIFSDNAQIARPDTPPSSPPAFPWELQHGDAKVEEVESLDSNTTETHPAKNVFSVLGKRKPLATTSDNVRPRKQQKSTDAKPLTQMQMSLGQKIQTRCKTCGMEYVSSSAEDRKLHDKFHKQSLEGCDVGKAFVSSTRKNKLFSGVKSGDAIVELDCSDHGRRKNIGQTALEVVQRELGAVPIPGEDIWNAETQQGPKEDNIRYRSYLYIRETKCIGYLLAERIEEAYKVVKPTIAVSKDSAGKTVVTNPPKNALEALRARKQAAEEAQVAAKQEMEDAAKHPIELAKTKHRAVLGVSRIWTSSMRRGEGIARRLLSIAVQQCNSRYDAFDSYVDQEYELARKAKWKEVGTTLSDLMTPTGVGPHRVGRKEEVAFSQPTDSGARLARKWFGKAYGWSVYLD